MNRLGNEPGDVCWRNGCQGVISQHPHPGCSCHIKPPCSGCTEPREYCPECGWEAQDDLDYRPVLAAPGLSIMERHKPRPLDPRKIDYRILGHSSCSQLIEGVCPLGTEQSDVIDRVKGTFGGRMERFADRIVKGEPASSHIEFRFIAYTE